ncbi:MAG: DUF418 domain-containing protein [Verrucomicrobiota bacterium]
MARCPSIANIPAPMCHASKDPPPLLPKSLVPTRNRIEAIDVIRGIALCGLVPMNILDFAFAEDHYFSPGDTTGFSRFLWHVVIIVGSGKFMSLFALLFGAGIILATQNKEAAGLPVNAYFTKRLAWLAVFGILHAYLIWYGDILVAYAVTGLIIFWCRHWRPRTLVIVGTLFLGVLPGLIALLALGLHLSDFDLQAAIDIDTSTESDDNFEKKANAAFSGSWLRQMPYRALYAAILQFVGIPFLVFWIAGGWMLLGIALVKLGFFQGAWPLVRYHRLALITITSGLAIATAGHGWDHYHNWKITAVLTSFPLAYLAMILLALGYAALIVYWCQSTKDSKRPIQNAFANIGRMALTNYIGQSLVLSLLFYGHGLGLRAQLPFPMVLAIVPAIWLGQAFLSSLWLKFFRFGPLEWIWRCLTYGAKLPNRHARASA